MHNRKRATVISVTYKPLRRPQTTRFIIMLFSQHTSLHVYPVYTEDSQQGNVVALKNLKQWKKRGFCFSPTSSVVVPCHFLSIVTLHARPWVISHRSSENQWASKRGSCLLIYAHVIFHYFQMHSDLERRGSCRLHCRTILSIFRRSGRIKNVIAEIMHPFPLGPGVRTHRMVQKDVSPCFSAISLVIPHTHTHHPSAAVQHTPLTHSIRPCQSDALSWISPGLFSLTILLSRSALPRAPG